MATHTGIAWTNSTFNPWIGCTTVSPGCDNCYAATLMESRLHRVKWGAKQPRERTRASNWEQPLRWNSIRAAAIARGENPPPHRVFCASLADVFDNEVPEQWRRDLFELIDRTPLLTWQLLTKRIGNAHDMIARAIGDDLPPWPWQHVWIGATVVNQEEADRDVPKLLALRAAQRFLSIEPMLGSINLQQSCTKWCPNRSCWRDSSGDRVIIDSENGGLIVECICSRLNGLSWVIAGGESGPQARPMHPDWIRSLRDQCAAAGTPFFFKQWGTFYPYQDEDYGLVDGAGNDPKYDARDRPRSLVYNEQHHMHYAPHGTRENGNSVDGQTHQEFPA